MRPIDLLLALITLIVSCGLVQAQTQSEVRVTSRTIVVPSGHVEVIDLPGPARDIHLGDEAIAVVAVGSTPNTIAITGKKPGSTNAVVLDGNNRRIFEALIEVPGATNVRVHSKNNGTSHEYWAYYCTSIGCVRTDDPHEGPVLYPNLQNPPQLNQNLNVQSAPPTAPPAAPQQ